VHRAYQVSAGGGCGVRPHACVVPSGTVGPVLSGSARLLPTGWTHRVDSESDRLRKASRADARHCAPIAARKSQRRVRPGPRALNRRFALADKLRSGRARRRLIVGWFDGVGLCGRARALRRAAARGSGQRGGHGFSARPAIMGC
jgi:hypothetical protein